MAADTATETSSILPALLPIRETASTDWVVCVLDRQDLVVNVFRGLGGLPGQRLDLIRHQGEAFAGLTCTCRLDAWRCATALVPVIAVSGCGQQPACRPWG